MKILLRNTQPLLGDRMMFTPAVRDYKKHYPDDQVGIVSAGPEIWHNNPHIDRTVTEANAEKIYNIGPGKVTRGSKTNGLHITAAFRESLQENSGKAIKQGPFKPDIHLSDSEKAQRMVMGRYWVINCDTGPFTAKRWRHERFQQLVESLPNITFVQVGLARDNKVRLKGDNVIDLIDKTKIRELFSLVYNADGCISLVSSLMHVAAAFDKPCVVIAGGREPFTFEKYANHRYLDTTGALPCCKLKGCWHNALTACTNNDGRIAACMDLISVRQVKDAIESYYDGGALEVPAVIARAKRKPILRIVANTKCLGGAERSWIEIAKMFIANGWSVELAHGGTIAADVQNALPPELTVTNQLTRPCDILLLYASDMVFNFDHDRFKVFDRIQAKRKVMALTYKIGKAGQVPWTQDWNQYLFLSTQLENTFLDKIQMHKWKYKSSWNNAVLAPPVDIEPFLKFKPDYEGQLRILRHSSQGDVKFPADLPEIMAQCKPSIKPDGKDTGAMFYFMPAASWMQTEVNVVKCPYQRTVEGVANVLSKGNCYWYLLPDGYTDQGPRVIVEAMAAGLPVICENRDGPADRVTTETGWKLDSHAEAVELINSLTPEILAKKGRAARERAKNIFVKEKWFEAITK